MCEDCIWGISIHALLAESDQISEAVTKKLLISIHALLAESDSCQLVTVCGVIRFLSTLSLRRATFTLCSGVVSWAISIHALLAESDELGGMFDNTLDISIHALLAESDPKTDQDKRITQLISIHALLAESDRLAPRSRDNSMDFYPRSPCGERQRRREELASAIRISIHALLAESDLWYPGAAGIAKSFLSTLSLRRATGVSVYYGL